MNEVKFPAVVKNLDKFRLLVRNESFLLSIHQTTEPLPKKRCSACLTRWLDKLNTSMKFQWSTRFDQIEIWASFKPCFYQDIGSTWYLRKTKVIQLDSQITGKKIQARPNFKQNIVEQTDEARKCTESNHPHLKFHRQPPPVHLTVASIQTKKNDWKSTKWRTKILFEAIWWAWWLELTLGDAL